MTPISIVWFRQDLRLGDNPALFASRHDEIIPVFVWDEEALSKRIGGASRWWLHHSLLSLDQALDNHLNIYRARAVDIIVSLVKKFGVQAVRWNRCYESWQIDQENELRNRLSQCGVLCESFNGSLLFEPKEILKPDQTHYKVFTPFYKNALSQISLLRDPYACPRKMKLKKDSDAHLSVDNLQLLPKIHWYETMKKTWSIGEKAAHTRLQAFLKNGLKGYKTGRDFPSEPYTSRLSPHLHFGEISPLQIYREAVAHAELHGLTTDADAFVRELLWRDFSYYLLYFFPALQKRNWNPKFNSFPWQKNARALKAWQRGQTGIPLVDAGMRELIATGFMHNRVRMVVASFLVKNLRLDWRMGEEWFFDYLVDADAANNSASWQWVAGSGADAAPYFRVFNPVTQGEKFDADGDYTRRWVPELSRLPNRYLFKPWLAPKEILKDAGIVLGKTYPYPLVDLSASRLEALHAYKSMRQR